MSKRLLNIQEASKYVSLSPDEIRERIALREFPHKNVSKGSKKIYRFDVFELDRWIDQLPGLTVDECE